MKTNLENKIYVLRGGVESEGRPLTFRLILSKSQRYIFKTNQKKSAMTGKKCRKIETNWTYRVILILDVFLTYRGDLEKKPKNKKKHEIFCFIFVFCRHTGVKSHLQFFRFFWRYTGVILKKKQKNGKKWTFFPILVRENRKKQSRSRMHFYIYARDLVKKCE